MPFAHGQQRHGTFEHKFLEVLGLLMFTERLIRSIHFIEQKFVRVVACREVL